MTDKKKFGGAEFVFHGRTLETIRKMQLLRNLVSIKWGKIQSLFSYNNFR